jgi:hypothetical protein
LPNDFAGNTVGNVEPCPKADGLEVAKEGPLPTLDVTGVEEGEANEGPNIDFVPEYEMSGLEGPLRRPKEGVSDFPPARKSDVIFGFVAFPKIDPPKPGFCALP